MLILYSSARISYRVVQLWYEGSPPRTLQQSQIAACKRTAPGSWEWEGEMRHDRDIAALQVAGVVSRLSSSQFGDTLARIVGGGLPAKLPAKPPLNPVWQRERALLETEWKRVSSIDLSFLQKLSSIVDRGPPGAPGVRQFVDFYSQPPLATRTRGSDEFRDDGGRSSAFRAVLEQFIAHGVSRGDARGTSRKRNRTRSG